MNISNINVEQAIKEAQRLIKKERVSPALKVSLDVIFLLMQILISRLGLNSRNSSKPPSQDQNRPKKKRESSDRKPGGQKGHAGKSLERVENPDEIKEIKVDRSTLPKGIYKQVGFESRQVFDLDISVKVTEYRAEILEDKQGRRFKAPFPKGVDANLQYGNNVKAHTVYLSQYQLLPFERIREYLTDQIKLPISTGSIVKFNQEAYEKLKGFDNKVQEKLIQSEIVHADETSININGKKQWLHSNSNPQWTYLYPHQKRGKEAMDEMGVLPGYKGVLVHDHWKPYYRYQDITHSLCNAHHLRELEGVWEQDKKKWAKDMQELLLAIKKDLEEKGGVFTKKQETKWRKKYFDLIKEAEKESPPPKEEIEKRQREKEKGMKTKRGRVKKSKDRNLLERLKNYHDDVLRFMTREDIPFTNNLGERDLRMMKVQQKISGCFRSLEGAKALCRIRSYISSAKKNNIRASYALRSLFEGEDIFGGGE